MHYIRWITTALLLLSLTHCGWHHATPDGPPEQDIDVSQIPNAQPKAEPRSHYGNPQHYTVMGRQYTLLDQAEGFKQSGTASWYGRKFHGHLTSNREYYDMHAMTAAHKTLPIPCYVKVTRQDTGQSIIVRVNDRGPFVDNRIIDLSYAAAKKLNMLGTGTAPVDIAVISSQPKTQHWLQVGAFHDPDHATSQRLMLNNQLDLNARIIHKDQWFRVYLGPFKDRQDAATTRARLNTHHIASLWIS